MGIQEERCDFAYDFAYNTLLVRSIRQSFPIRIDVRLTYLRDRADTRVHPVLRDKPLILSTQSNLEYSAIASRTDSLSYNPYSERRWVGFPEVRRYLQNIQDS